jgi:hypothetical protein
MKLSKQVYCWLRVGLCVMVCLSLTACSKKVSPQEVKQTRLAWNLTMLVGAYKNASYTDAKWDESATNALVEFARSRSQSLESDEDWTTIIRSNCDAAVQVGCDDPMIRYLYIKFSMSQTNTPQAFADVFCETADKLQQSSYPPIRKFYAALRALQQVYYAYSTNADRETIHELAQGIMNNLMDTLDDKTTPPEEIYDACHETLAAYSGGKTAYEDCYNKIEQPLFQNWPNESISWLLKGEAYVQMAWLARGGGYANTVTEDQWKSFRERLATAEKSLDKAWKLNPKDERIPREMMTVELGQGKGRDRMELWFNRAMKLDPNDYDACSAKLYYLEPKWYGSTEAMLEFGRECVTNQAWKGQIPLILLDAHKSIQRQYVDDSGKNDYWKQPEVWSDIKSAFDRFFELNPDAIGWYHNYAWYAYQAGQWDTLNEIIPKLGPINYSFFGGKDEFDKMVELAKVHAGKPAAGQQ